MWRFIFSLRVLHSFSEPYSVASLLTGSGAAVSHALTVMIGFVLPVYRLPDRACSGVDPSHDPIVDRLRHVLVRPCVLAFPWLSVHFGEKLSGRANTAMNLLIFSSAFGIQYVVGRIIDLFPPTSSGGYAPEAYQVALGAFTAMQVAALLWYFVGRSKLGHKFEDTTRS